MGSVEDHYERFLAENYTWMSGGHELQIAKNRNDFIAAGFVPGVEARALDLGCGSGYQTLALAEIGYSVVALDSSARLLDELQAVAAELRITPLLADMRDAAAYSCHGPFDLVVCMGDSIIHLQTMADVAKLFQDVYANLNVGGRFVVSFRDLSHELTGTERILPVRMDDHRIMAVFLEYGQQHVTVNDVLIVQEGEGWRMRKSAYQKLRLPVATTTQMLMQAGLREVTITTDQWWFSTIIARKTAAAF